jgi:protein-disulfide isomerase
MSYSLLHILAATTVVVACARSDAAPPTKKEPSTAVATAMPTPPARDSISDRADRGRVMGDSTAALWVIMASDFQCPYCKQWHDADFQPIVDKYVKTGRIRLAFLNMPLAMHQHAVAAAEAAMCSSVQNKFWPMHDGLFATQKAWENVPIPSAIFDSIAKSTGVNLAAWRACVKDHLTLPLVQADRERVVAAQVRYTPTFFVGDQLLTGYDAKLAQAIDSALAKAPGKKPTR